MRFQAHSRVHCPVMTNSTILVVEGDEKRRWPGAVAGLPPPGQASLGNPSRLSATPLRELILSRLHLPSNAYHAPPSSPDLSAPDCILAVRGHLVKPRRIPDSRPRPLFTPLSSPPHLAPSTTTVSLPKP